MLILTLTLDVEQLLDLLEFCSPDTYIDEEKLKDLLEICSLDAYLED